MKLRIFSILAIICVLASGMPTPASERDTFTKGIESFNAGQWGPAADLFRRAAQENPRDEVVRLTTGVALANVKRYPEAAEQFEWAARMAPQGVLPLLLLDGTYTELGNASGARQARTRANSLIASKTAFGGPDASDTALVNSLAKYPRNAIAACLLGDVYQLQAKIDSAKEQYAKAAALAPLWAKPNFNLGLASLSADPKAAEVSFGRSIELDPSNLRAYLWLGDAYLKQKLTDKAVAAYEKAANDRQLAAEAKTRIGNAQMQAGNYAVAQEAFTAAAAAAPQDPRPVAGQAQVLQNTGDLPAAEQKYKQAGSILAQNAASPSSRAVVSKQMADVQVAQGRLDDAYKNYSQAYDLQPTYSYGNVLAQADKDANKLAQSIAEWESVLQRNPDYTRAMVYLLAAYKITGNQRGRVDMAERLIRRDPSNTSHYAIELGCARAALGDANGALDAFSQALVSGDATVWTSVAQSAKECGVLPKLVERYDRSYTRGRSLGTGKALYELISALGDAPGAVSVAEKLARQAPEDNSILLRLGQAYERAGRTAEAIAVYTKVASCPDATAASAARQKIGEMKGKR